MSRILKWNVPVDDQEHEIGPGPVVHVGQQGDPRTVQVWTTERDQALGAVPQLPKVALVVGTGHHYDGWAWRNAGSVIDHTNGLVWHILIRPGEPR